ncbi:MAG: hypothetical protein KGL96_11175, partial [Hyphomicrobiales bacterium]|nr:hypothetical protein [Hyphomicrobiales bacterium]
DPLPLSLVFRRFKHFIETFDVLAPHKSILGPVLNHGVPSGKILNPNCFGSKTDLPFDAKKRHVISNLSNFRHIPTVRPRRNIFGSRHPPSFLAAVRASHG